MPKKSTVTLPPSQMETRDRNKKTFPGTVDKPTPRRTTAEVQQEKAAKAQAKKALAEARKQSIKRTAEFERADIANEDTVDATPRPTFTPKPRPLSRNPKHSSLTTITGTSDIGVYDDRDETPFMAGSDTEITVDTDNSAVPVDNSPPPPVEKKKAKNTQKPEATAASVDTKKPRKTVNRKRRVADVEDSDDVPMDSEQPLEPKPKRVKVKTRDEINVAATEILENEKEGNKYAQMVNSMGSSGTPASKVPPARSSQLQAEAVNGGQLKREGAIGDIKKAVGGRKLKREGAIADINYPEKSITLNLPDSSKSTRPDPGNKGNNIR